MADSSATERQPVSDIHRCRLLIDGYNLLFAIGLLPSRNANPRALQRARESLITLLASRTPDSKRKGIWWVFDSADAPKDLPGSLQIHGMTVYFSRGWVSADEMLQTIIGQHPSPKAMTVISSDHAVQRKAIARGATVFDSEDWEHAMETWLARGAPRESHRENPSMEESKPGDTPVSTDERNEWLRRFGFPEE